MRLGHSRRGTRRRPDINEAHRKIARELAIHRETVGRYARVLLDQRGSKPATVTPGSLLPDASSKPAKVTPGSATSGDPKPATVTTGSPRARSLCEPFRQTVIDKLELGLSAQRIHQDLTTETDFSGSYERVKRFVRRLSGSTPLSTLPLWRGV